MTRQQLIDEIYRKKSFLCVGLDVDKSKIPDFLLDYDDPIFEFNKRIIDATKDLVVAYKPNTAFYEQYGIEGLKSLEKTMDYIPDNILKIADAKRGDIGNTSQAYAKAFFDQLGCDAITVSPYMGSDSIKPYLGYEGKFTIVLGLTSNQGANDFQQLILENGSRLYEKLIQDVASWGSPDNVMFVVGATNNQDIQRIRKLAPGYFFLVPGVGTQGGSLADVIKYGWDKNCCLLVNSSRAIIYASKEENFDSAARSEALKITETMKVHF